MNSKKLLTMLALITLYACNAPAGQEMQAQPLQVASVPSGVEATCTGDKSCNACKNCKYCKHCSKEGGKCGVCR